MHIGARTLRWQANRREGTALLSSLHHCSAVCPWGNHFTFSYSVSAYGQLCP